MSKFRCTICGETLISQDKKFYCPADFSHINEEVVYKIDENKGYPLYQPGDLVNVKIFSPMPLLRGTARRKPKHTICTASEEYFLIENCPERVNSVGRVLEVESKDSELFTQLRLRILLLSSLEEKWVSLEQVEHHFMQRFKDRAVFIPFNTPSSKNSKIKTERGLFHSKVVSAYLKNLGVQHFSSGRKEFNLYKNRTIHWPNLELKQLFSGVSFPLQVYFFFVRGSKRHADFHNLVQLPLDLMTASRIIPDDDMDHVIPAGIMFDNKFYGVNPNDPGLWVIIK